MVRIKTKTHVVRHEIPVATSLCAPAIRLLAIEVTAAQNDDGAWEDWCEFYPVVAVESVIQRVYEQRVPEHTYPRVGMTHPDMRKLGWEFVETEHLYVPLIADGHELMSADVRLGGCMNSVYRIYAAPWNPSEDEARLEPLRERLRDEAIEKAQEHSRERAKAQATKGVIPDVMNGRPATNGQATAG